MKLFFLRHGLADRSEWSGEDFKRPLTARGRKRMQYEAEFISRLNLRLEYILTSPLTRAAQTAEIVAERLGLLDSLEADDRLSPGFGRADVAEILNDYPKANSIMFVGHEPDFSHTIEGLIGGGNIVCKKGSLARIDMDNPGLVIGELVWLIPPKALAMH